MNKKAKILVVDDDTKICDILQKFLIENNFNVTCVNGGAEAIELLSNETFDLVLCDYVMPRVTGYDVARFLNAMDKKSKLALITAWSELIRNKEKEEMNLDFLIKKPIDFSELETYINGALDIA
jgi:DNA-binding response OmpR family regulator